MMTREPRYVGQHLAWVLAAAAVAVLWAGAGCSSKPQADSTTNWLRTCSSTSECGDLECVCGKCTATCESDDACGQFGAGAECSSEQPGADGACVSGEVSACVLTCSEDADCDPGLMCEAGFCVGAPSQSCVRSSVVAEISVTNVDKVDLLFVVDDSASMIEEQQLLRDQFSRLVAVLTTGEQLWPDGTIRATFPAVTDLHLGVVSSDMGTGGVEGVPRCDSGLGQDGRLRNSGDPAEGCAATYPQYLSYVEGDDGNTLARDFQCVATLGTGGCGFVQPLEAGLKALWPALDIDPSTGMQWVDPNTGQPSNRITFLPDGNGDGLYGHGDGANAGFLRNDVRGGLSMVGVVVVTDKDDCSSSDTMHFTPAQDLPDGHVLAEQSIDLRCFNNKASLYSVDRYINGLRALRQGQENLFMFAAIAGVPSDLVQLVDAEGNPTIDVDDDAARDAWYSAILGDPRMAEHVDESEPEVAERALVPSCQTETAKALPPRRLVEVARGMGPNGMVQSICDADFSGAMDGIVGMLSTQLGAVCLPRVLRPSDSDGAVPCDVLWELPTAESAGPGVPVRCDERDFLATPEEERWAVGARGGNVCVVRQLSVPPAARSAAKREGISDAQRDSVVLEVTSAGDGWLYDDFSSEVVYECPQATQQRITFTDAAKPPTGVTVLLSCREQQCTDDSVGATEL